MLVKELIAQLGEYPPEAEIRLDNGDYSLAVQTVFYVEKTGRVYIMPQPAVHITGRN